MTYTESRICYTQQRIYRWATEQGYDMESFSDEYMGSDFCRMQMDTIYSRYQLEDAWECSDEFLPEIGNKVKKNKNGLFFDADIAEWIGYTYRQLYFETGIPSEKLKEIFSFDLMCAYYPGMHTIDEDNAIDIMLQDKKLNRK